MSVISLSETYNAKFPSLAVKPAATKKHIVKPACIIICEYMIHLSIWENAHVTTALLFCHQKDRKLLKFAPPNWGTHLRERTILPVTKRTKGSK